MELPHDPMILLGVINMKLRDFYPDLEALCDDMDLDLSELSEALTEAGFFYDKNTNQFHKI
ncbi:MAG: DUF4250 domain-containing protein [Clostridiales bacterium 38-18]|mgnify:CR=1 FL=1|nr:MAG: DUF4250 domain-containing protein [Clostridiales bacterium 38-18]